MREDPGTLMDGVTEYADGSEVLLAETAGSFVDVGKEYKGVGRLVIRALNQGGHDCTEVDLLELLAWLKANRPDLMG